MSTHTERQIRKAALSAACPDAKINKLGSPEVRASLGPQPNDVTGGISAMRGSGRSPTVAPVP